MVVQFGDPHRKSIMIQIEGLQKSFGDIRAVNGVSMDIRRGETFGLLGPNGAGKTTTIHIIVGAKQADAGTVRIDGQSDPSQPDARKRIGVAPQALAVYRELSGMENVLFFGSVYGMRGNALRERADWAIEQAGLTDRAKHRAGTYSGGMQRQLNMACALVHDPEVILLDEPTVGVDPQSRNHLFDTVETLKAQGKTILYTTHYMEEAQRLCDRVAIMDHGKLLAVDSVDHLIRDHGGHAVVTAVVEHAPADVTLPEAVDGGATQNGELHFASSDPMAQVLDLSSRGVRFGSLKIDQPNLESVFLNLTGRSLRD